LFNAAITANSTRPFIGLRPFEFSDAPFFFGRKDATDAVEALIRRNQFVAIVGSSGTGKSSLVQAGLLPRFESSQGERWKWTTLRPGEAPIERLARAISSLEDSDEEFLEARTERVEFCLRRSRFGIAEGVALVAQEDRDVHFMIIVDQFEELFRFARLRNDINNSPEGLTVNRDEATAFVRLLLAPSSIENVQVHIVITMRSDFIGDCSHFYELPEVVTKSQFLVPGLTRDQRAAAIQGPIDVAHAGIEPELVQRILNDTSDDPDQLPVVQHTMMRCWSFATDRFTEARGACIEVGVEDYVKVGGVANALSVHADQILKELSIQKSNGSAIGPDEVVKRIFQALTEVDIDGRGARRPLRLVDLERTVAQDDDIDAQTRTCIAEIVERLALPDCSFLRVTSLADDAIVDIGHEALIRRWSKLKGASADTDWIREEQEDGDRYRDLVRIAKGGGIISTVELPLFEQWWKKRKPTRFWGKRYTTQAADYYDEVRNVLTRSREAAKVQKEREFVAANTERMASETRLRLAATESAKLAESARAEAEGARARAAEAMAEAAKAQTRIAEAELFSRRQQIRRMWLAGVSVLGFIVLLATAWTNIMNKKETIKAKEKLIADQSRQQTDLIAARATGLISRPIMSGAGDALALLTYEGSQLVETKSYSKALSDSLRSLRELRRIVDFPRQVLSVATNPKLPLVTIVTAGSPPVMNFFKVFGPDENISALASIPTPIPLNSWAVAHWSPDGERLLIGGPGPTAIIITPCGNEKLKPYFKSCEGKDENEELPFGDIKHQAGVGNWLGDGTNIITTTFQGETNIWNSGTGKLQEGLLKNVAVTVPSGGADKQISAIVISGSGKRIAVGEYSGKVKIINASNSQVEYEVGDKTKLQSPTLIMFNPANDDELFVAYQGAEAVLWNIVKQSEILKQLAGTVFQVAFDPKGTFLVTASNDALVRLWDLTGASGPRILEMRGHIGPVFSVDVRADGAILSGGADRTARFWRKEAALGEAAGNESRTENIDWLRRLATEKLPYQNDPPYSEGSTSRIELPKQIACVLSSTCDDR
jgi:WD40 repeat protein